MTHTYIKHTLLYFELTEHISLEYQSFVHYTQVVNQRQSIRTMSIVMSDSDKALQFYELHRGMTPTWGEMGVD